MERLPRWQKAEGVTGLSRRGAAELLIQLCQRVLHWVYGFSLGREDVYNFWLRRLRQFVLSLRTGKAGPTHRNRPLPGHRATAWCRPGVSRQLLRSFVILAPELQALPPSLHPPIC